MVTNVNKLKSSVSVAKAVYRVNPDVLPEVEIEKGSYLKKSPKMLAKYWVAMSYEYNISVWQKRIIMQFLSHLLFHPDCSPQHEI